MPGLLPHSPADVLSRLLIDLNQGATPNTTNPTSVQWPVHAEDEPDLPDNSVTVQGAIDQNDGRSMPDNEVQLHHGILIRVRARTHREGWQKANAIMVAIQGVINRRITVEAHTYLIPCVSNIRGVRRLGDLKDSKLKLFTINCTMSVVKV